MRILCVTNLFPHALRPGKGIFNWREFAALGELSDVRVIAPVPWVEDLQAWKSGCGSLIRKQWSEWNGVAVVAPRYLYPPKLLRGWHGSCFEASVRRTFDWAVGEFRPSLVYACFAYPDGWAACRLAHRFDLPVAIKLHGSDILLADEDRGRRQRILEALRQADCLFPVSAHLRHRAIEMGASEATTHVGYEGTDTDLFCPGDRAAARRELGLAPEGFRLLFVGNLIALKGIIHLLDACQQLLGEGLSVTADILGDGPLRASLRHEIVTRGLAGCVTLRGWQPQPLLPQWYRAANVVVLPSYSEGIPNVLVEAAACGIPFVATSVGSVPEIAHLTPVGLIPPRDSEALTKAVRTLLNGAVGMKEPIGSRAVRTVREGVASKFNHFKELLELRQAAVRTRSAIPSGMLADPDF